MSHSLRLAALALSSLVPGDRAWILSRLPAEAARKVAAEMSAIPLALQGRDLRELLPALHAESSSAPGPSSNALMELFARGNAIAVEDVACTLEDSPEWLVSTVFAAHPWRWAYAVRNRLGLSEGVLRRGSGAMPTPTVLEMLARAFVESAESVARTRVPA